MGSDLINFLLPWFSIHWSVGSYFRYVLGESEAVPRDFQIAQSVLELNSLPLLHPCSPLPLIECRLGLSVLSVSVLLPQLDKMLSRTFLLPVWRSSFPLTTISPQYPQRPTFLTTVLTVSHHFHLSTKRCIWKGVHKYLFTGLFRLIPSLGT